MSMKPPPFETGSRAHVSDSLLDKSYTVVKAVYENLLMLQGINELTPILQQIGTVLAGQLLYKAELTGTLPDDGTTSILIPWPEDYGLEDAKSVTLWGTTTDGRRYLYQDFSLGSNGVTVRIDPQAPEKKRGIVVDLVVILVANIPVTPEN